VSFSPSSIRLNRTSTIAVHGSNDLRAGAHFSFLAAGSADCTGALFHSTTSGGILSPNLTLTLTPSASWTPQGAWSPLGLYKACASLKAQPTVDTDYTFLAGAMLTVTSTGQARPAKHSKRRDVNRW
jgi:hypothetical protein